MRLLRVQVVSTIRTPRGPRGEATGRLRSNAALSIGREPPRPSLILEIDQQYPSKDRIREGRSVNHFRRELAAKSDYSSDRVCSAVHWTDKSEQNNMRVRHLRVGLRVVTNHGERA